jgi:DNA polymerase III subunit gamma/tau
MASYVVLARKYRPRAFEDMVGQDVAVRALSNALSQQRLHHAYLFTGTRGIGKTTVSRIFAKCLNCLGADGHGGITPKPCGICEACTQIDQDRFIDYIELDAASNRGIAEIRDLLDRAAYKPSVGRFKVFMIDEAHQLTKESFNALLKTLEEPPEYVKFILATTDPQKMPATVLSRCLQFNLRPMAPPTVREHLAKVLEVEGIGFDDAALNLLGRAANGSMRDALSLADQAIAYGGGKLEGESVRAMLGSVGREPVLHLVDALVRRDAREVVTLCDTLREHGTSGDGTLEGIAVLLQEMALEQAAPGAVDDTLPDIAQLRRLASAMPADDVQLLYSIVLQGRRELPWAPDEHAGLVMVLLRLLAFPSQDGGGEVTRGRRGSSEGSGASAPAPRSAALAVSRPVATSSAPSKPASTPVTRRDANEHTAIAARADEVVPEAPRASGSATDPAMADRWATTVDTLVQRKAIASMARTLAMQSQLESIDVSEATPCWVLTVTSASLAAHAVATDKLAAALSEWLGAPQRLRIAVGAVGDTPAMREAARRERRVREAERIVHDDPLVQSMLSRFKTARIVPGSIQPTQESEP